MFVQVHLDGLLRTALVMSAIGAMLLALLAATPGA